MKQYVLLSVDFKKDLGTVRRKAFGSELKKNNWNQAISSASAWWKRLDEVPGDQAERAVQQAARNADIKQYQAIYQISDTKPQTT